MTRVVVPAMVVGIVGLLAFPMAVLGIAVLSATGGIAAACSGAAGPGGGPQQVADRVWSAEQMTNARTITEVTVARVLPRRAAVIATATAIVESNLINVHHGDRDSLGLFQQRPSQGWGSPEQVTNPAAATHAFLDRLVRIPSWHDPARVSLGEAAQSVQRSAYPERYQPRAAQAKALVDRFWKGPDNPPDAEPGPVTSVASAVTRCPDQGGSDLPLDPQALPPGYRLPADPRSRAVVVYALAQLGKPYVYGVKGPDAFDCSGLTQAAWAHAGVAIAAGTHGQRNTGDVVPNLESVRPGDLLLIPGSLGSAGNPRHVGLYVGHGLVVNAYDGSTGVILDRLESWADQIVTIRRPDEKGT